MSLRRFLLAAAAPVALFLPPSVPAGTGPANGGGWMNNLELPATALAAFSPAAPASSVPAETETVDGIAWTYVVEDGRATVGNGESSAICRNWQGAIAVPPVLGGHPVTRIGAKAFDGCAALTAVTIPDGVTEIASQAFYDCLKLKTVRLPAGLTDIGDGAFAYCHALAELSLPDGVANIGRDAFVCCFALEEIAIPAGTAFIGQPAFLDCKRLRAIHVAEGNPAYASRDGLLFSKDGTVLLQYPCARKGPYAIPDGVTAIAAHAFNSCNGLTELAMPASVTDIGEGAFAENFGLAKLAVGPGVTNIGAAAFWDCGNLAEISIPGSVESIGQTAFVYCNKLKTLRAPASWRKNRSKRKMLEQTVHPRIIRYGDD
jgi:hypothetical protein